jgi:nucleoside-diphosphate-sugar epimerase
MTHVIYAALYERPELAAGWLEQEQMRVNDGMLRNALGPLIEGAPGLRHVALLQGAKAYGVHVRRAPVPSCEGRDEARDVPNFYWLQEDWLKQRGAGADWRWTIFRPPLIVGRSLGSAMNVIPALGVYAALLREAGEPLHLPADSQGLIEAVDADLLARALAWAGEAASAADQVFNVTNGDVMSWPNVWPAIARALDMRPGAVVPVSLAAAVPPRAAEWDTIRERHGLVSPALDAFVGLGLQYVDLMFLATRAPGVLAASLSTVKLRQAGFQECMHSEDMWRKWFDHFRAEKLLP